MYRSFARSALLASTCITVGVFAAQPAAAQDTGATPATTQPVVTQDGSPNNPSAPAGDPAAPVAATTTDATAVNATPAAPAAAASGGEIVVTGSLFRRKDLETPSPVTQLTAADLTQRGITTVTDALQSISANNGSNLPTSFSANGAFAAGASAVSLRGLTTDSTLVVFDGLRAADYPLADDGTRSFVDLNTIPDAIVDRIQVLKDGGSSTYGADAVAGVVNVIIKKQITGISGTVEGGISQRHDAGHQRLSLTAGYGDLKTQGFNFYVSGEYQHDDMLYNRQRGYPYNTQDTSRTLADDGVTPDANNNPGANGVIASLPTTSAVVTAATEAKPGNIFSGVALPGALPQVLGSCASGSILHSSAAGGSYCEQNTTSQYGVLQPSQTRAGVTARGTVNIGEHAQAYLMGTYYQDRVYFTGGAPGTGSSQPTTVRRIVLPATLRDGTINPQDPYANTIDPATGQRESALLNYNFGGIPSSTTDFSRTYRIAGGINGSFGNDWHYTLDGTYMKTKLDITQNGLLSYTALQDAIETGSYNFVNPAANSQAQLDALSPQLKNSAKSSLWQVQGTISKGLMELPGGTLQLAVGGQARYESINDPIQDPIDPTGSYSPYQFVGVNLFTAAGHRYNEAGYFELNAPVFKQLEIDASGRFDHYSEGFSHFSPKVGVKFTPIEMISLRGTFSKGFRAPSIPETSGQVIGFVTATPPAAVVAAHDNDAYVKAYSLGQFNTGNPNLKPELSTTFTGGAIVKPTRWLTVTADYYHIKKTRVIVAGPEDSTAIANYYAGIAPPDGYTVTANPADPAHPDAIPTVDIVSAQFVNAASLVTDGIDLTATANLRLSDDLHFTSSLDATRVFKLDQKNPDGTVFHFAGTEGPYANTSDSGTPKWRGTWSNTLQYKKVSLTGTAYYTGGYKGYADDYTYANPQTCDNAIGLASDGVTSERCHVKRFIDVDATLSYTVNEQFNLYTNVINVFDAKAPFDPNTYGGVNYNPAFAQAGVVGRYFRVGANFKF